MPALPQGPQPITARRDAADFEPFLSLPNITPAVLEEWLSAMRIEPLGATEYWCADRWTLGPREISDSMWFWFEAGSGWGRVGERGRRFAFGAGDLVLIPKDVEHVIQPDPGVRIHLTAVHFHAWVYGAINLLDLLGFPAHVPRPAEWLWEINRTLPREAALQPPGWRGAMEAGIRQVLLYILRHHGDSFRPPATSRALPRLLPVLEWIDRHLGDPDLDVPQLAAKVFVCESRLRRLFKRATGASPVRFIRRRRIDRACALLDTTQQSVEQVAASSGFRDAPYFCRVFKKMTGMSPGQYRKAERL